MGVATCPTVHRTVPPTENDLVHNVDGHTAEKP